MNKPDLVRDFEYNGKPIRVNWFDINSKEDIPNLNWKQVYAIGEIGDNGQVAIVHYPDDHDNLPGGTTEPGESIEQTLKREIYEETGMKVLSWETLGYQEWIKLGPDPVSSFALRVYAKLAKGEKFTSDSGGEVIGHSFVPLDKLNDYINYGIVGNRMIELAKNIRSKNNTEYL